MSHRKRNNIPQFYPIPRKGTKYVASSTHNQNDSIPLVIVSRNILGLVKTKKELQKLLHEKKITVNHINIREPNYPVSLFDIVTIIDEKKNLKVVLSKNKKYMFEEITEKASKSKVYKVLNKKLLPGKKIQLNLMNGINIISKDKVNTGDSVVLMLDTMKIEKVIPMEKGKNAYIVEGKHAGHSGKILEIMERGGKKIAKISSEDEKINVWVKNIVVIE